MASSAAPAPSKAIRPLQIAVGRWRDAAERRLEAERDQLFLFLPVMLGGGIAAWLLLPDPRHWAADGWGARWRSAPRCWRWASR